MAIPDRLSTQQGAPFYKGNKILKGLRVSVDDVELKNSVIEYCVSKGWARILVVDAATGKPKLNLIKTALATKLVRGKIKVWKDEDGN